MKISVFPACLSIILTAALSYLVYNIAKENEDVAVLTTGAAISFLSTLAFCMSFKHANSRVGVNVNVWCIVAFIIMLIVNLVFAWTVVDMAYYIILMAILLVVHFFILWNLSRIKNV